METIKRELKDETFKKLVREKIVSLQRRSFGNFERRLLYYFDNLDKADDVYIGRIENIIKMIKDNEM